MERRPEAKFNAQICDEACKWFLENRSGDLDAVARGEFDLWLRKSPEHLSAYLEIAAIWNEGPELGKGARHERAALIAEAMLEPDNVVPLTRVAPDVEAPVRSSWRMPRAALVAGVATLAVSVAIAGWLHRAPSYETATGEQRLVTLEDGSTIELNSRSAVRIRFDADRRGVELTAGQALFNVAKDRTRPFIVTSGDTQVRAIGTQFDVYRKSTQVVVTVVEGNVEVSAALGAAPPMAGASSDASSASRAEAGSALRLGAGEQLTVGQASMRKTEQPNVSFATAWTRQKLIFDSASMLEVAEEFNRYNQKQLVIEDPARFDFHISGVFSTSDPTSLLRFLRSRGAVVVETDAQIRIAKK